MTPCPDEATILAFGRGEGDPALRRSVTEHLVDCEECRSLVSVVIRSSSMVLAARAVPAPVEVFTPATEITPGAPVNVGDVVAGKYKVERVLGTGGVGVLVAASHLQLDQRFALRFLAPAACASKEVVARFLEQGDAAARITSEHAVRVFDTGQLDSGVPYLVMEYLEGKDLRKVGVLGTDEAVEYVLQAAEALGEAHALGMVHRDLQPAKLFLAHRTDGSPLVKVLDFGISNPSANRGASRYLAPEQLSSKSVDARADVWALGVILYELVTGEPLWRGDTPETLGVLIASAPTPALPGVPAALEEAVGRCLAKSPANRLASVADLALLLAPIANAPAQASIDRILRLAGRSRSVPIPKPPPVLSGPVGASTPALSQTPAAGSRTPLASAAPGSARVAIALAAVIALVGLGAGGVLLYERDDGKRVDAPPPPVVAATMAATPVEPVPEPVIVAAPTLAPPASASAPKPAASPRHRAAAPPSAPPEEK